MTDRELMQQALDALVHTNAEWKSLADSGYAGFWKAENQDYYVQCKIAIEALRARLAQPEQEELGEIVPADEEQLKRIAKLVEPEQEPQYKLICPTCKADRTRVDCQGNRMNCGLKFEAHTAQSEPAAWMYNSMGHTRFAKTLDTPGMHKDESVPLYTAPPQRGFIGLTDEEIAEIEFQERYEHASCARAIEAKLKEKNT